MIRGGKMFSYQPKLLSESNFKGKQYFRKYLEYINLYHIVNLKNKFTDPEKKLFTQSALFLAEDMFVEACNGANFDLLDLTKSNIEPDVEIGVDFYSFKESYILAHNFNERKIENFTNNLAINFYLNFQKYCLDLAENHQIDKQDVVDLAKFFASLARIGIGSELGDNSPVVGDLIDLQNEEQGKPESEMNMEKIDKIKSLQETMQNKLEHMTFEDYISLKFAESFYKYSYGKLNQQNTVIGIYF